MMDIQCRRHKNHQSYTQGGNEREHEKKKQKMAKILAAVLAAALGICVPETTLQAAETQTSVQIQMPGFVVEQFSVPRLMNVTKNAVVRTLPDNNAAKLTSVTAGNTVWGWGQTNTGWYFVQVGSQIGYVRYEAAAYATQDQIAAIQHRQPQQRNKLRQRRLRRPSRRRSRQQPQISDSGGRDCIIGDSRNGDAQGCG